MHAVGIVAQLNRDVAPVEALAEHDKGSELHLGFFASEQPEAMATKAADLVQLEIADATGTNSRMELASSLETPNRRDVDAEHLRHVPARNWFVERVVAVARTSPGPRAAEHGRPIPQSRQFVLLRRRSDGWALVATLASARFGEEGFLLIVGHHARAP